MATEDDPGTLEWFVQASGDDVAFATECATQAAELVTNLVGTDNPYGVPESTLARVILEVGADLYYRKASRNGIAGFEDGGEPQPMRLNRDPLAAAYPILRQFLPMGL